MTRFATIAKNESGLYVSGFIGAGFPGDVELRGTQTPEPGAPRVAGAPANIQAEFDNDSTLGVALGYEPPGNSSAFSTHV